MRISNAIKLISLIGTVFSVTSCACSVRSFDFSNSTDDKKINYTDITYEIQQYDNMHHVTVFSNSQKIYVEHTFTNWTVTKDGSSRTCRVCGYNEISECKHKETEVVYTEDEKVIKKYCLDCGLVLETKNHLSHSFVNTDLIQADYYHTQCSKCKECGISQAVNEAHDIKVNSGRYICETCLKSLNVGQFCLDDHVLGDDAELSSRYEICECNTCGMTHFTVDARNYYLLAGGIEPGSYMSLSAQRYVEYDVDSPFDMEGSLFFTCSFTNKSGPTSDAGFTICTDGSGKKNYQLYNVEINGKYLECQNTLSCEEMNCTSIDTGRTDEKTVFYSSGVTLKKGSNTIDIAHQNDFLTDYNIDFKKLVFVGVAK